MELRNVTLAYGDKTVLEDFSLTLPKTGVLCLSGPSGCGKTTLLRVLCGLETPGRGTVTGRGKVSAVFQEDRLLPWVSVEKNLTAVGMSREEALMWLARLGLQEEAGSRPADLSGGMRRRVAIARALGTKCDLLLLDEPFTGLDAETRLGIYPYIREIAEKIPVVLVTHHPEEAQALGAKILPLEGPPLTVVA